MATLHDLIGLLGVTILLIAYFLLQSGKLTTTHLWYSILNLLGALMILYSLFFDWNLSAVVIETVWALISVFGIWRVLSRKK